LARRFRASFGATLRVALLEGGAATRLSINPLCRARGANVAYPNDREFDHEAGAFKSLSFSRLARQVVCDVVTFQ